MTLAEIIARMNQIDAEVRSCTEAAQIEALTAELTELQEKESTARSSCCQTERSSRHPVRSSRHNCSRYRRSFS